MIDNSISPTSYILGCVNSTGMSVGTKVNGMMTTINCDTGNFVSNLEQNCVFTSNIIRLKR